MNRRDFLRALGVGAATIPFLPSWLIRRAQGDLPPSVLPLFATVYKGHGGWVGKETPCDAAGNIRIAAQQPGAQLLGSFANGHQIHAVPLTSLRRQDGSLSDLWGPEWNQAGLLEDMNVFLGMTEGWQTPGHTYSLLGNRDGTSNYTGPGSPTLDRAIADSVPYRGLNPWIICFGSYFNGVRRQTAALSDPANLASGISYPAPFDNPVTLWEAFFGGQAGSMGNLGAQRAIDRVLLELTSLRGNALLGESDRASLDGHEARLAQLRQSLAGTACGAFPIRARTLNDPNHPPGFFNYWQDRYNSDPAFRIQVMNYVLDFAVFLASSAVSSLGCTRPVILSIGADVCDGSNHPDLHHYIYHPVSNRNEVYRQDKLYGLNSHQGLGLIELWQRSVGHTFRALASKLKAVQAGAGTNLLDESLVVLAHESGMLTHDGYNLMTCTAGGAGGRLNTGLLVDLMDRRAHCHFGDLSNPNLGQEIRAAAVALGGANWYFDSISYDPLIPFHLKYHGAPYIHVLNTLCRAAGLSPEHYETPGLQGGYHRHSGSTILAPYRNGASGWNYGAVIPGLLTG